MNKSIYFEGKEVEVMTPSGWMKGKIKKIIPNYGWTEEAYYEISGKSLYTLAPERVIRDC